MTNLIKRTDITTKEGAGRGSKRVGREGYAALITTEDHDIYTVEIWSTAAGALFVKLTNGRDFDDLTDADIFAASALRALGWKP